MGFQNWLITHGFMKPKSVELPPEEKIVKSRKVYLIEYTINYTADNGEKRSYHNAVRTYDYEKHLELHKLCNERTIKNTKIINEFSDDKFVILDCGIDKDDLVPMKRNHFISCSITNNEK